MKQNTAVDLSKRLKDFRALNDASSLKGRYNLLVYAMEFKITTYEGFLIRYKCSVSAAALEEWRKRKMERARQRDLEKTGGVSSFKTS